MKFKFGMTALKENLDNFKKEISNEMIERIKNLYDRNSSCIRIDNNSSRWFTTERGVKQGSVMSPWLFYPLTAKR